MTNAEKLVKLAREAGCAGIDWGKWTASDEVQDLIDTSFDSEPIKAAYAEGRRELLIATWRIVWTTAPEAYDGFGTQTIEACGTLYGKVLRRVVIEPSNYVYQTSRYGSGLHPSWEEDPRVEEARSQARIAASVAADNDRKAKHDAGIVWLQTTATDADLEDFDTFESRGLRYDEVRAEKQRRESVLVEERRDAEWAWCAAAVPDGVTLIDEGEAAVRGKWGIIPGRDAHVYYNVKIVRGFPNDADHANVIGDGNDNAGSLLYVAQWIKDGRLRIVKPEDNVPPRAVLERIGQDRVRDIRTVEVDGRKVWVGRPLFSLETLVLDEKGHLVRSKKILAKVVL
ncbi:MAG: hypothetical protein WBY94_19975 [Polyangiaceae bacterium]